MLLALASVASAQGLRFPTTEEQAPLWSPNAYVDHDGVDWACGELRYDGHRGSDFGAGSWSGMNEGRDIVAAAMGTVVTAHDGAHDKCVTGDCSGGGGFGNHVRLLHPDGSETIYAHMKKDSVVVVPGQGVQCGDPLGQMGSSGHSFGPHLHFEVRDAEGTRVDPFLGACSEGPERWLDPGEHGDLPGTDCDLWPACEPLGELRCGETVLGSTAVGRSRQSYHGCSAWTEYTGPEVAYTLDLPTRSRVEVRLTGLSEDLDLWVLEDLACDATACLEQSSVSGTQTESLRFEHDPGQLVLVLDGWRGAVSDFELSVSCTELGPLDTSDPLDSPDPQLDSTPPEGGCSSSFPLPRGLWFVLVGTGLCAIRPTSGCK